MSAFVVSPDTMRRAVRGICGIGSYSQPIVQKFGTIETQSRNAMTRIGRLLYAMNIAAVEQRYPDTKDNPKDLPGPCDAKGDSIAHLLARHFKLCGPSPRLDRREMVECLKSLHCLHYQCSEGDIPETRRYKDLELAIGRLANAIALTLPEYNAAAWD